MKSDKHDNRIGGAGKARNNGGFTLAETLLAVLILLLVSTIVATGMPAAVNAYNKVVLGANAKVMLSTAITALHDEIGTAWNVEKSSDNQSLTYFNASTGAKSQISLDDNNAIQIKNYMTLNADLIHDEEYEKKVEPAAHLLVSDPKSEMYVTFSSIEFNPANYVVTVKGLKVCKKTGDTTVAEYVGKNGTPDPNVYLTIRVISKNAVESGT